VGHFLAYECAVEQKPHPGLPIVIISSLIGVRWALKILTHPDDTRALTPACFVASKTISGKVTLFHVSRGKEERKSRERAAGSSTTTEPNLKIYCWSMPSSKEGNQVKVHPIYTGGSPAAKKATSSGGG